MGSLIGIKGLTQIFLFPCLTQSFRIQSYSDILSNHCILCSRLSSRFVSGKGDNLPHGYEKIRLSKPELQFLIFHDKIRRESVFYETDRERNKFRWYSAGTNSNSNSYKFIPKRSSANNRLPILELIRAGGTGLFSCNVFTAFYLPYFRARGSLLAVFRANWYICNVQAKFLFFVHREMKFYFLWQSITEMAVFNQKT